MNAASHKYEIGRLQDLRLRVRSLKRLPSRSLFDWRTTFDTYAFHVGGRSELQFNIGVEDGQAEPWIRFVVAFSLELSQSLPSLKPLFPKIARFNDYVRTRPEVLAGFRMWHFNPGGRSPDRPIAPIEDDLIKVKTFIAVGRRVPASRVRASEILESFDRLLPIYRYVEATGTVRPPTATRAFRAGCPAFVLTAQRKVYALTVDVALRHKDLQGVVYERLCEEAGKANVRIEHELDVGLHVDAVVRQPAGYTFYELKVAPSPQACIRTAIGQLLEYSYWPSEERAVELVVLGEHSLDAAGRSYLDLLRSRFNLPLWYRRVDLAKRTLGSRH